MAIRSPFRNLLLTLLALPALSALPSPAFASATPPATSAKKPLQPLEELRKEQAERGRKMSLNNCLDCHTFDEGGPDRFGPNLFGIVGKKHAAEKGYAYSKALTGMKKRVWTEKALDEWIYEPQDYAPGTTMKRGEIKDDNMRRDIIEYLKTLK